MWDSIDDRKNPSSGLYANFHQDIAGLGGQSHFLRETFDGKYYYPLTDDLIGLIHLQGGQINQIGGGYLPLLDNFNLGTDPGARLRARRHRPARHHRSVQASPAMGSAAPTYFGGSAEVQFPIFGLPKEIGLKGAIFADAGTLFGYQGQTELLEPARLHLLPGPWHATILRTLAAELPAGRRRAHDPIVGRREHHLGVAARADPHRLRLRGHQGQVRPAAGVQLHRRRELLTARREGPNGSAPGLLARFFMDWARLAPIRQNGESTHEASGGAVWRG